MSDIVEPQLDYMATIEMQSKAITALRAEVDRLRAALVKVETAKADLRIDPFRLKNECVEYCVQIRDLEEEVRQLKTGLAIAEDRAALAEAPQGRIPQEHPHAD